VAGNQRPADTTARHLLDPRVPFADAVVWLRDGLGLVGHGGWTITVGGPRRLLRLAALWRDISATTDQPLTAFVSSVFDDRSGAATVLRIPHQLQRRHDGVVIDITQHLNIADLREILAATAHAALDGDLGPSPGATLSTAGYQQAVAQVVARIGAGDLAKVVLSRDEFIPATEDMCHAALAHLADHYAGCWTFAVAGLFGATPEILAARRDGRMISRVLAGSLPRGERIDDAHQRARLLGEAGLLAEHTYAARSVVEGLADLVELDDHNPAPYVLELPNIFHLATDVTGRVRRDETTVLELVNAIHPTAAVGGTPREAALDVIAEVEPRDRGRYAGPIGWLDSTGDGEIGLALRCGIREGDGVRLHAGGGIVAGADPAAEVAETVTKMAPMRQALTAAAAATRTHRPTRP